MKKDLRLRAAPSPTGRVHFGNLRTFLYNLFLVKQGGKFILRVEDTDSKRKVEKGLEGIVEVLALYGVSFDEGPTQGGEFGPYIQSERLDIYAKYAKQLIDSDHAYYCFCSEDRLNELREQQSEDGEKTQYDRKCRDLSKEDAQKRVDDGESHVIRMRFPIEGYTTFKDTVYGKVSVKNDEIDDLVMIKADGFPTYHFAVVVDDHLMEITHVFRGREYLADTPRNIFLYEAFGWESPIFVHLPHVLNADGAGKLSKRKGALSSIGYLRKGYLAEACINYLALAGWAPKPEDAKQDEIYSVDELVKLFSIDRIQKSNARYDEKKLDYMNGKHIRNMSVDKLTEKVIDWAENLVLGEFISDSIEGLSKWEEKLREEVKEAHPKWKKDMEYFKKALNLVYERLTYLGELPKLLDFFYLENLSWTDEDWKMQDQTKEEIADALVEVTKRLDEVFKDNVFDHDKWEEIVRGYADELEWKHGTLFLAIRSATTGRLQSPPLLECYEVIGWDKTKEFIDQAVVWLKK